MRLFLSGTFQSSVVTEPARHPIKITKSAWLTISLVAKTPPFEPTTPTQLEWVSGILPCPETVVATAISRNSTNVLSSFVAPASTTPPPQIIIGNLEDKIAFKKSCKTFKSGPLGYAG